MNQTQEDKKIEMFLINICAHRDNLFYDGAYAAYTNSIENPDDLEKQHHIFRLGFYDAYNVNQDILCWLFDNVELPNEIKNKFGPLIQKLTEIRNNDVY